MNFYISDLHFGHQNILSFDSRPFADIETHDDTIIENWNNVVGIDDTVYILGDISWHNSTKTIEILKQLNGSKVLIKGNHDHKLLKNPKLRDQFVEIMDYKEIIDDNGNGLVLCHYPIIAFRNHYYGGWWHFYGHVHSTWEWEVVENAVCNSVESSGKSLNMVNVGCMMPWIDYTPRTFTEIVERYSQYKAGE